MRRFTQLVTALLRILKVTGVERRRRLFQEFRTLGGVYIKFLQVLAVNQNFMAGWSGPAETMVFEDVEYEPIDLDSELSNCRHAFSHIELQPFAAGSFAQVYRATLTDGATVVCKVLRPSVRKNLSQDLRLMAVMVHILMLFRPSSMLDLRDAYREIRNSTELETDYKREVSTALWFHEYFTQSHTVVVPYTYAALSGSNVIVQEYIEGVSLSEVMTMQSKGRDAAQFVWQQTGSNVWQQLSYLGYEYLKTALVGDYVLADPHPGNVKLLPGNKIGLIDFGLVTASPANREPLMKLVNEYAKLFDGESDIVSLSQAMMEYIDHRLVSCLERVSRQQFDVSFLDGIGSYIRELVQDHATAERYASAMKERRIAIMFNSIINEGNRFGVHADPKLLILQRSMLMYMSMMGRICRPNGMQTYTSVVRESLRLTQEYVAIYGMPTSVQPPLSDTEAYEYTLAWLEGVADKNTGLMNQIGAKI